MPFRTVSQLAGTPTRIEGLNSAMSQAQFLVEALEMVLGLPYPITVPQCRGLAQIGRYGEYSSNIRPDSGYEYTNFKVDMDMD